MNGVFDLGGIQGFGAVEATPAEPPFNAEWERVVFALQLGAFPAGWFTIDSFRHGIELMDPVHYLTSSYFEHWLESIERRGIGTGNIDPEELDRRTRAYLDDPSAPLPPHDNDPLLIQLVDGAVSMGSPADRPTDAPQKFEVGDLVQLRHVAPIGHTRLARYVRGKRGTITAHRGSFVYPDSVGNDLDDDPQHLYTVQFDGAELWGSEYAENGVTSTFDAWEPYLVPIDTAGTLRERERPT